MSLTPVDDRLDLSDPDLLADHLPLDEFAWLRQNQPARWNPQIASGAYGDGGFWAVTRHADVTAINRSSGWSVETNSAFVRRLDETDPTGESTKNLLLCMDPPRHTRVRRVGNRCFTPRALAGLEDDLRERAQRIIWAAKSQGTGDFVIDVSRHLPLQAIAGLMGIPDSDRQRLFHWSDQMAGSEDPEYANTDLSGVDRDVRLRPFSGRGPGRRGPWGCHQPARPTRRRRSTPEQRGVCLLLHDPRRRRQRDHPAGDHPRHVGLPGESGPVGTVAVRTSRHRSR